MLRLARDSYNCEFTIIYGQQDNPAELDVDVDVVNCDP